MGPGLGPWALRLLGLGPWAVWAHVESLYVCIFLFFHIFFGREGGWGGGVGCGGGWVGN